MANSSSLKIAEQLVQRQQPERNSQLTGEAKKRKRALEAKAAAEEAVRVQALTDRWERRLKQQAPSSEVKAIAQKQFAADQQLLHQVRKNVRTQQAHDLVTSMHMVTEKQSAQNVQRPPDRRAEESLRKTARKEAAETDTATNLDGAFSSETSDPNFFSNLVAQAKARSGAGAFVEIDKEVVDVTSTDAQKRKESPVPTGEDESSKKGKLSQPEEKVSTQKLTHKTTTIFRLQTAETIMLYLLHCKWRRGMTRRCRRRQKMWTETNDNEIRTRTRSEEHLGRTKNDRKSCVSHSWRVSQHYMLKEVIRRAQRCQKQTEQSLSTQKYIYIGSHDQQQRMAYIYKLHCILYKNEAPDCILRRALHMHLKSTYTSNTTASKLERALHPARERGGRPGRPAGPGLPYGDCTGDDD